MTHPSDCPDRPVISPPAARAPVFSPEDLMLGVATIAWLLATASYCLKDIDSFWGMLVGLMSPIIAPFWLAVPAWALVVVVRRLLAKAYVAAALAALIPIVAVTAFQYGPWAGAFIRFAVNRPSYVARIEAARTGAIDFEIVSGAPLVAFFPWGGSAVSSYGVVFDESDVIARPLAQRQSAWRYRAVPGELLCDGSVVRLSGHFYLGRFAC